MKMVVGLGNPGPDYKLNRHNAGFMLMEGFYKDPDIRYEAIKRARNAFYTKGYYEGVDFVLVQPRVYMNTSGLAFLNLREKFDFSDEEILVIHDDVSFDIGKFKLKQNGGDGGHKGVRSIIDSLDSKNFSRLRIGIQNPDKTIEDLSDFVLENFTQEELDILISVFPVAVDSIKAWLTEGIAVSMNMFNTRKEQ
jgi:peptidyl-tRNA hydrolase, PTH1 family